MAFYNPSQKDYSTPYKTFNDLSNGDHIFIYNIEKNEIYDCEVSNYGKKGESSYFDLNRTNVKLLAKRTSDESYELNVFDGNSFIAMYHNGECFAITDNRIVEQIKYIILHRNQYQWSTIMQLFGGPLDGYAKQPVILG